MTTTPPSSSLARNRTVSGPPLANSLLLRLFESEFFDSRLAAHYLNRYPESIGIQHYICNRLEEFSAQDLEFLLPQFCHLLVCRQVESVALENWILRQCQKSNHFALLTIWFLQAHLSDLHATPNTEAYRAIQRMYHRCQALLFADALPKAGTPPTSSKETKPFWKDLFHRTKMRENVRPAVVGIGAVLAAGVCSMVVDTASQLVLSQGCKWKGIAADADATPEEPVGLAARRSESVKDARATEKGLAATAGTGRRHSLETLSSRQRGLSVLARIPTGSPTPDELSGGGAFSFARYVAKTSEAERAHTFLSSPGLDGKRAASHSTPKPENLKRSHFFHAEMQFMKTLVDISDRLRAVPKEARQSTLFAELALINHNLPANVCLPAWCGASAEHPTHHRVARISPSDAVVLNSADRVPYLITVEVLEDVHPPDDVTQPSRLVSSPLPEPPVTVANGAAASDENGEHVTAETLSPNRGDGDVAAADYHRQVLHRRKSAASMKSKSSFDGLSPVNPQQPLVPPNTGQVAPVVIDEFSERLRTAAVMLAQLYQQQQREETAQNMGNAATAGSATSLAPGSPMVAGKNRTNQQKLQADFESIKKRLVTEMVTLEEQRVQSLARQGDAAVADEVLPEIEENLQAQCQQRDADDPSAAVFRETWDSKMERIRAGSPFGRDPTWRLLSVIVKSGADLRQEQLALQLIEEMQRIWRSANVPVWVRCFRIMITSDQSGIMETVRDAISVHSIKKEGYAKQQNERGLPFTLYDHFVREFGHPSSMRYGAAQDNFMRSLAAYSIVCYLLQIKDRHNGNILLDIQGHVIHIDFGFMLSNSPGGAGFELAPFKFPQEYVDILGGRDSEKFAEFRALAKECFLALRKRAEEIVGLVEMMEHGSKMSCFTGVTAKPSATSNPAAATNFMTFMGAEHADGGVGGSSSGAGALPVTTTTASPANAGRYPVAGALRDRFHLALNEAQVGDLVDSLIDRSCGSAYTRFYDTFQYYANGIL
ncbi:Phosphatidylinositol 4-kinase pik1alpha (PI4-kinase)(PtdIns-4-kinase) [Geranomyces variabilis]|uniref:1-phosphatidylinositol 4-kinase n=1 Tax=Geranomyces variabilis TaxID=109894 RepID=A0AAD5TR65_9FUNG|nr:Phosphatidylinositol 4-kinase pik1alpha (PI4-kinase)(PtdIns-4-kinase) [Geranomyces variabilis]